MNQDIMTLWFTEQRAREDFRRQHRLFAIPRPGELEVEQLLDEVSPRRITRQIAALWVDHGGEG